MLRQGCSVGELLGRDDFIEALTPHGFAGVAPEGVAAIMGVCEQNAGNWRCWAHTDPVLARRYFVPIVKRMRTWLAEFHVPRIETVVLVGNMQGLRWTRDVLGFKQEGIMRNAFYGADAWLLSRVNR